MEYAKEAVKQGSAAAGLKVRTRLDVALLLAAARAAGLTPLMPHRLEQSDNHVVLVTLKRAQSELSSFQRKVFKIDDHMGIAIAGLTADGRMLCRYMRNECINHR